MRCCGKYRLLLVGDETLTAAPVLSDLPHSSVSWLGVEFRLCRCFWPKCIWCFKIRIRESGVYQSIQIMPLELNSVTRVYELPASMRPLPLMIMFVYLLSDRIPGLLLVRGIDYPGHVLYLLPRAGSLSDYLKCNLLIRTDRIESLKSGILACWLVRH